MKTSRKRRRICATRSSAEIFSGRQVRVVGGAFCDCIGLYEGMSSGERVAILLELLGAARCGWYWTTKMSKQLNSFSSKAGQY